MDNGEGKLYVGGKYKCKISSCVAPNWWSQLKVSYIIDQNFSSSVYMSQFHETYLMSLIPVIKNSSQTKILRNLGRPIHSWDFLFTNKNPIPCIQEFSSMYTPLKIR